MTATDELREGLTKRGVEWRWEDERTTYWYVTVDGEEWGEWTAIEMGGYLHLSFSSGDVLTPEQAIEATLGESMTDTEKAALERRIDELCAELSTTQLNCDLWHDRAEDMRNRLSASQAEKAALCTRIDELCQENERLHAAQAHWELGNCPSCPNIADLQEALDQNAKLREQVEYMTPLALYAASERERDRMRELGVKL